jgi:hypothetical protein
MRTILVVFTLVACVTTAGAQEARMVQCESPRGKRVDYGNLQALDGKMLRHFVDGPEWSDDGYGGVRPVVMIEDNTMFISWANAVPENLRGLVDDGRHVKRIAITGHDEVSVWGTTMAANTAAIWRYYLNYDVLYLLESSIGLHLQDPLTAPSMAAIYISRCEPM